MEIDFAKHGGLIPVVVQDSRTNVVLMVAFMNKEALETTISSGKVTFYSRTKGRLWTKGETSGHFLMLRDMMPDCDNDSLLIKAEPCGPVCHTGADTCFNENNYDPLSFLRTLIGTISHRKSSSEDTSYTASLFKKGINKVAQKVGEEAVELIIEAKDSNKELFLSEAADLLYHYLVLLEAKDHSLAEVVTVLEDRNKSKA